MNDMSIELVHHNKMMVAAKLDVITSRENRFPATIAIVELLMPYYQTALSKIAPDAHSAVNKLKPKHTSGKLSDALLILTVQHLSALENTALLAEKEKSAEILLVAKELKAMLNIACQTRMQDLAPVPERP
jgi:hypothetical protein